MNIRTEITADRPAVFALYAAAFPTPAEARLVDRLRADGDAMIALVAEDAAGQLVGHVLFSRMQAPFRALALAPVAVADAQRRQGIAAQLIRHGLAEAERAGWQGVFVLGDPAYYQRFGFTADTAAGFASPYAGPYFMALPLGTATLSVRTGEVRHAEAFAALA